MSAQLLEDINGMQLCTDQDDHAVDLFECEFEYEQNPDSVLTVMQSLTLMPP